MSEITSERQAPLDRIIQRLADQVANAGRIAHAWKLDQDAIGAFTLKAGATNSVIWGGVANQMVVAKMPYGQGRSVYLNIQYLTSDTAAALGGGSPAVGPYAWAQQLLLNSVLWAGKSK